MTRPALLDEARLDLGLSLTDLWLAYFTLGGTKTPTELGSYLAAGDEPDRAPTTDADHDAVVHALNEAFADRGEDHPVPYRVARSWR